ncbi:MAG TPA: type II toxin-antitoxin system VapC family toxin [Actinophytocola sp.]|uniref:type II toxin-antitoxin system VapC family toxin n=1 Tax=Actinophytocola sp. TaxID=1872138 RepID=UPI002E05C32D|nr:type II toxin-antitoxin system VapC family toxin [Actinophytocola sp.]
MTLLYADTSAVVRAYVMAEPDHAELRKLLVEGTDSVVTSELTRVEFAGAVAAAGRARRIRESRILLDRFDGDCGVDGSISLLQLDNAVVLPLARRLVTEHFVHTLDAIHLAVALSDATALAAGEPVVLVTRDKRQAEAARALGLSVY